MKASLVWQSGGTWLLDITIVSDATVGTHTKTITIQPATGADTRFLYGRFLNGAGTQTLEVYVDSGATANLYSRIIDSLSLTSGQEISYPTNVAPAALGVLVYVADIPISGNLRLVSTVSSAVISLTDRWWFALRIRGREPTVTAADSLGTPTITTNENRVY